MKGEGDGKARASHQAMSHPHACLLACLLSAPQASTKTPWPVLYALAFRFRSPSVSAARPRRSRPSPESRSLGGGAAAGQHRAGQRHRHRHRQGLAYTSAAHPSSPAFLRPLLRLKVL
jgi:hypothetical protein